MFIFWSWTTWMGALVGLGTFMMVQAIRQGDLAYLVIAAIAALGAVAAWEQVRDTFRRFV